MKQKEALLLKAFHEGSIVIADEINASPMMERYLNALLMGTTPEGVRPQNPGFMIIGTQNPMTMAGRKQASLALQRRFIQTSLPPYSVEEIHAILEHKGVPGDTATPLAKAYCEQVHYASVKQLNPAPCFRDLMRCIHVEATQNPLAFKPNQKKQHVEALSLVTEPDSTPTDPNESLKETFIKRYKEKLSQDRSRFYGFFAWTRISRIESKLETISLEEILSHAQKADNRSRSVCVKLGWLTKNGRLNKSAPDDIKTLLNDCHEPNPAKN